ncbi:MAG: acyloxyacyl hydrolase [Planctomycetota bacterium]
MKCSGSLSLLGFALITTGTAKAEDSPAAMWPDLWQEPLPLLYASATGDASPTIAPIPSADLDSEETSSVLADEEQPEIRWRPESFVSFAYGDEGGAVQAHIGASYEFDPIYRVEVVPQLGFGVAQNTDQDRPLITSFDLQMRWTPWEYDGWEAFLEWGAGLQYVGPESMPRSGTHANGRLRAGVGIRYYLEERMDLLAGAGWLHMSNGNALQPNVGHDGPMFYLGLSWRY